MKFESLMELVWDEPVFHTHFLLAGQVDPADVHRQLTRWKKAGKVIMLRRGVYCLAPPYSKKRPHPYVIANHLVEPSYVSCQSALGHHQLIPEAIQQVVSVTTGRPVVLDTPLGRYSFRHVDQRLFSGYRLTDLGAEQHAYVASAEKALLDLIHLEPGADDLEYLRGLRLQHMSDASIDRLVALAELTHRPKWMRAAERVRLLFQNQEGGLQS